MEKLMVKCPKGYVVNKYARGKCVKEIVFPRMFEEDFIPSSIPSSGLKFFEIPSGAGMYSGQLLPFETYISKRYVWTTTILNVAVGYSWKYEDPERNGYDCPMWYVPDSSVFKMVTTKPIRVLDFNDPETLSRFSKYFAQYHPTTSFKTLARKSIRSSPRKRWSFSDNPFDFAFITQRASTPEVDDAIVSIVEKCGFDGFTDGSATFNREFAVCNPTSVLKLVEDMKQGDNKRTWFDLQYNHLYDGEVITMKDGSSLAIKNIPSTSVQD